MIISPFKIKTGRLLNNIIIDFDTPDKHRKNMVVVATHKKEDMYEVIKTPLFRPQQIKSVYTPRVVRPMQTKVVRFNLQEVFDEYKANTNGKIKIMKHDINLYMDNNLFYDISRNYNETMKVVSEKRSDLSALAYMQKYLSDTVDETIDSVKYNRNYLVFPLIDFIPNLRNQAITNSADNLSPLVLFFKAFKQEKLDSYKKFDRILFFNPKANVVIAIDPSDESILNKFNDLLAKVARLNNYNDNSTGEMLSDILADTDLDDEDRDNMMVENLKDLAFNKIAKNLKIKGIDDFEAVTREEQELMMKIEAIISKHIQANPNISIKALLLLVEEDDELKLFIVKYLENRRLNNKKYLTSAKNRSNSLATLETIYDAMGSDNIVTADNFNAGGVIDKRIQESSLLAVDRAYNAKTFKKDIISSIYSLDNLEYLPATVDSMEFEDTSDDFNEKETLKVRMKTDEGQSISFTIDVPKIVDDHYMLVGGNKYIIAKQQLRIPIVKTKSDRVEIASSYTKMTVERAGSKFSKKVAILLKILKTISVEDPNIKVMYGDNTLINGRYYNNYDYEELSKTVSTILGNGYQVILNRALLEEKMDIVGFTPKMFEKETPIALDSQGVLYCIQDDEKSLKAPLIVSYTKDMRSKEYDRQIVADDMFMFIKDFVLNKKDMTLPTVGKSFMFSRVHFIEVQFPIFVMCALMKGMTNILRRYDVEYSFREKSIKLGPDWTEVKFANGYMYYKNTSKNSLLLNCLYLLNTEEYNMDEFDTDRPYMDFLVDKLKQPLYVKNTLMINLDKMIDPITKEVLKDLSLPTNIIDLLLMSNTLLTNNAYTKANDLSAYRIRGNEVVSAMLYNILAGAYRKFQNHRLNGRPSNIKIGRKELISALISEPNINTASTLNPILELESAFQCSPKGLVGINMEKAYGMEARTYDDSMVGYLSGNSTAFSGAAGINRTMVYNPKIDSVRGYTSNVSIEDANALSMLSIGELVSPFTACRADPQRIAMQISQTKHNMPVAVTHKQLFGSGITKTIPHMLSDDFTFKAKQDGVVQEIDTKTKTMILKYDDGTYDAIDMKQVMSKNTNSGFFIRQDYLTVFKAGERFKKGEILAYDNSFFKGKGMDVDFCPGTLCKVAIAPGDFAFEDATMISESLSKNMASRVTMNIGATLRPDTEIYSIVNIGDEVAVNDKLIEFIQGTGDSDTDELLANLGDDLKDEITERSKDSKVTKYSGRVVDIKIYYNTPYEELHQSIKDLIEKYRIEIRERRKKLSSLGISRTSIKIPPIEQQTNSKINGVEYEGLLIEFYVEYLDETSIGDKISFATSLKGIVSKVMPVEESPITEFDKENPVEAICTPTGIISRLTIDSYSMLYGNKVLVHLGRKIKEIWNK